MENYGYAASYPESGGSSPRSREIEFDNTQPPWDDPTSTSPNYKVKFMCSYGGKIHPRPHDNQLSYIGGETKILAIDRAIKFSGMISKLSALSDAADVCFKYQLPGEDLDALISVTNDDDLEHMMHEYDRLYRGCARPARMRLFLFHVPRSESGEFGSGDSKTDRERFVEALNSGPTQSVDGSTTPPPPAAVPNNVDFLFGLDKGVAPPPPVAKLQEPVPEPEIFVGAAVTGRDDRAMVSDPIEIQRRIQELQRLQIGGHEQAMYRPKSEENLAGGAFAGDFYASKFQDNLPPATIPTSVAAPQGYWPDKLNAGGGFPAPMTTTSPVQEQGQQQQQQPMYMIQTPSGMYHAPMPPRQMTGQAGQGYYAVPRMAPEFYREQPVYNVMQPTASAPSQVSAAPPRMAAYSTEGMSMGRSPPPPSSSNVVGVTDTGYTQVAYDSAGRQLYYTTTTSGGVVPQQTYQGMAAVNADMRQTGGLGQEGK